MITALIFDCFGVLYQGSLDHLRQLTPTDKQSELNDLSRASDYGYVSRDDYMQRVGELTGLSTSETERIVMSDHVRNQAVVDMVKVARKHYKTALLSNVGSDIMSQLFSESELQELFDVVVLSSDVNLVKPHPAIFELAAERLNEPTEQCVMIDDIARNIDGAREAGMEGIVFTSAAQLTNAMNEFDEGRHLGA